MEAALGRYSAVLQLGGPCGSTPYQNTKSESNTEHIRFAVHKTGMVCLVSYCAIWNHGPIGIHSVIMFTS